MESFEEQEIATLRRRAETAEKALRISKLQADEDGGRLRRLRNALMAAGVSEGLVAAIEWDQ